MAPDGFDLHFLIDNNVESFHVFFSHVFIFFKKLSFYERKFCCIYILIVTFFLSVLSKCDPTAFWYLVSYANSVIKLIGVPLHIITHFSLMLSKFLFLDFYIYDTLCVSIFIPLRIYWAFWMCKLKLFMNLGSFQTLNLL